MALFAHVYRLTIRDLIHRKPGLGNLFPGNLTQLYRRWASIDQVRSMSRPSKTDLPPAPLYLTTKDVSYCHTCGRIISAKKSINKNGESVKYCSHRCRQRKPGKLDQELEKLIYSLLEGREGKTDGDSKSDHSSISVTCDEIETLFFRRNTNDHEDETKMSRSGSNMLMSPNTELAKSSQSSSREYTSTSTTSEENMQRQVPSSKDPMDQKSKAQMGQKRAEERETVRRAARRAVVFGVLMDEVAEPKANSSPEKLKSLARRKCEAVQNGRVVEPSFAKGNWAIRWRG